MVCIVCHRCDGGGAGGVGSLGYLSNAPPGYVSLQTKVEFCLRSKKSVRLSVWLWGGDVFLSRSLHFHGFGYGRRSALYGVCTG